MTEEQIIEKAKENGRGWNVASGAIRDEQDRCPVEAAANVGSFSYSLAAHKLGLTLSSDSAAVKIANAADVETPRTRDLRAQMLSAFGIVCLLMALAATSAHAQQNPYNVAPGPAYATPNPYTAPPVQSYAPNQSPYVGSGVTVVEYPIKHAFGNVFIGPIGDKDNDFQSYLAIASKVAQQARITIYGVGEPVELIVFIAAGARGPQENGQPLYLNELLFLRGVKAGISVEVELEQPAAVSIAMHPAANFFPGVVFALETAK